MSRKVLLSSAALALAASVAHAGPQVTLSDDNKIVSIVLDKGSSGVPGHVAGAYQFSDIARKYPDGLYLSNYGNTICGPSNSICTPEEYATQWVQAADARVTKLSAAVGYISGDDTLTLTLYADSGSSTPGAVLASTTGTTSTPFGTCCGLVKVKIPSTKLKAGQAYWIGISTTGANWEAAGFSVTDEVDSSNIAYSSDEGTTWTGESTIQRIAVAAK